MALFGTQTNTPEYLLIGQLAPVIELTGGAVPNGTDATLTPAGTTSKIYGSIVVSGANRSFVPNPGQTVPAGATVGASTASLQATGHTTLSIVTHIVPAQIQDTCPTPNALYEPVAIVPNTIIEYTDGRRDRVLITDLAGANTVTGDFTVTGSATTSGNSTVTGNLTVNGNVVLGNANTDTVAFYGVTPVARPTALTTANAGVLNTGDATSDTVIGNMRTRINELEAKLQSLGLLQ